VKALVAGWFSFEEMGATAGDLLVRDVVCGWLRVAGVDYDVALAPPFRGGVDWREVDPTAYSHVVFACGPFGNGWPLTDFLPRFDHARLIGVDVSMLQPLHEWNPFDLLLERDSSRTSRPDVSFVSAAGRVPVVGVVLVHPQSEYEGGLHHAANEAVERLLSAGDIAGVQIDTRLDVNAAALRTPAQVESLIARTDAVVTTRLHGLVLALKNGVPALALDPIAGGAKVRRQAETIGWPVCFTADSLDDARLLEALDWCLTGEARAAARAAGERAAAEVASVRDRFLRELRAPLVHGR
jgi:hypothetical protein